MTNDNTTGKQLINNDRSLEMYEREKSEILALKRYLLNTIPLTPLALSQSSGGRDEGRVGGHGVVGAAGRDVGGGEGQDEILLSTNSLALKAAIEGLDKELKKLEREERLLEKFSAANASASDSLNADGANDNLEDVAVEYVKMTKEDVVNATLDAVMDDSNAMVDDDEWQETDATEAEGAHAQNQLRMRQEREEDGSHKHQEASAKWAASTIARISNDNVKVATPLGALSLGLHAALMDLSSNDGCGSVDSFVRCTGIPTLDTITQFLQDNNKKGGGGVNAGGMGFAPPIRELPKGLLVPSTWEDMATKGVASAESVGGIVAFRYKCGKEVYSTSAGATNDATTVYLVVHGQTPTPSNDTEDIIVTFGTLPPTSSFQNQAQDKKKLKFSLGRHVNLDGFRAAKTKSGSGVSALVPPSLFYKSLSELLLQFATVFELLPVMLATFGEKDERYQDTTNVEMIMSTNDEAMHEPLPTTLTSIPIAVSATSHNNLKDYIYAPRPNIPPNGAAVETSHNDPLRVIDSHTQTATRGRCGDFEGDLLPGGPQPGLPGMTGAPSHGINDNGRPGLGGGSQVGPNHPIFDRTFGDDTDDYLYSYDDDGIGAGYDGGGSFRVPGVGGGLGMHPR